MPSSGLPSEIEAYLFDMDGTLLTSVKVAERVWSAWAIGRGIDPAEFLPTIHGVQAVETIRRLGLPDVNPEAEAALITQAEMDDVEGIEQIVGAGDFLRSLPPEGWAIVTSAPRRLALRRLQAAGLPTPAVLVTAEDVEHGKPAPDCFLLAARMLDADITKCLVFEDSPAGILAAQAAGARLVIISATHGEARASSHTVVQDYVQLDLGDLPAA